MNIRRFLVSLVVNLVNFEVTPVGGTFVGKFKAAGSEIGGVWKQGGESAPLVFKRSAK